MYKNLKNKRSYLVSLFKTSAVAAGLSATIGLILWGVLTYWFGAFLLKLMGEKFDLFSISVFSAIFIGFIAEGILICAALLFVLLVVCAKPTLNNFRIIERLRKIPLTSNEYQLMNINTFEEFNSFMYQLFDIKAIATETTQNNVSEQLKEAYCVAANYFDFKKENCSLIAAFLSQYIYNREYLCNNILCKHDANSSFVVSVEEAIDSKMR